jgi:hypothetical protein
MWIARSQHSNVAAETLYFSHTLEITMRSSKGTNFGITRMLRSGTPVEVLDVDKKSSRDTF